MIKMVMMMMAIMMMGVVNGDIVDQTCKQTPDYNLCVSLLRSDSRSSSADTAGLALILVDKIKGLATQTLGAIDNTYKTKPTLKAPLDECKGHYTTVNSDVKVATIALTQRDRKVAQEAVVDVGREATVCETRFPKGQSPLTNLTQSMSKICDVTTAIIKAMH